MDSDPGAGKKPIRRNEYIMDEQTRKLKADLLAGEILQMAQASLLLHLRFMESALGRLTFTPMPKGTSWTDGRLYSYAPRHVLMRYKAEAANPARDYLHSVLHCVFRHMYLHAPVEKQWWSLACDMIVEDLIAELQGTETTQLIVGDGAQLCYDALTAAGIPAKLAPPNLRMQSAWGVARLALEKARAGVTITANELAPVYHRLSQAERERLEREGKNP